jgi:hypothetical protein
MRAIDRTAVVCDERVREQIPTTGPHRAAHEDRIKAHAERIAALGGWKALGSLVQRADRRVPVVTTPSPEGDGFSGHADL